MADRNADGVPFSVKLRRAAPEEANALTELAIRSKAYWGYDESFMAACAAELTVSREAVREYPTFVLDADGIAGFYMLCPLGGGEVELEMLFVAPGSIGRGYGKQLLEHAKEEARSAGCRSIVIQGDPHADGFYRAQGAERVGDRPSESIRGRLLPVYRLSF